MLSSSPSRLSNVALTYSNDRFLDGAGAQLHRSYNIYALSRFLDVSYVHSPIKELGYYGLSALERNEALPEIVTRYNDVFSISSDVTLPPAFFLYDFVRTDLDFLSNLKNAAKGRNEFHLVRIVFSDALIGIHPPMLRYIKEVSPFEKPASSLFRIAIHVRRGDLLIADSERMLPNSFYISVALQIIETLHKLDIPFVCELYTELPSKTFVVTPDHHGMKNFSVIPGKPSKNRIETSIVVDPQENQLEDFDVLPHLKKFINTDPIETMQGLATADLVLISRSCFSYLAALLNKKGIVVYHPFWHAAPLEWLDATHALSFRDRLLEACERWKEAPRA